MEPASGVNTSLENLSVEALADLVLRQDQVPLRPRAMRFLAERIRKEPEQLARLTNALRNENPSVRRRAAQTLGGCGSAAQSVLPELSEAMRNDPMWTVREAAVHAVSAISWPASEKYQAEELPRQLFERALSDREPLVREAAIQALIACFSDPHVSGWVKLEVRRGLKAALSHPHASRRCRAITAVSGLPDAEYWVGLAILNGLEDSHWKVRRTTAEQLGQNPQIVFSIEPAFILPELIKRAFDQHPGVQSAAREAAGRLVMACKDEASIRLFERLTSTSSAVETLLVMLKDAEISQVGNRRFRELCHRRMQWHSQNLPEPGVWEPAESLEGMARQLLALAAKWQASPKRLAKNPGAARQAAEEKEAAWLLARWLKIFFLAITPPDHVAWEAWHLARWLENFFEAGEEARPDG